MTSTGCAPLPEPGGMNSRGIDVLIEQTAAVAPERLGALIGRVSHDEQTAIDHALLLALQLD